MPSLSAFFLEIQPVLFDRLELCVGGPLSVSLKDVAKAIGLVQVERHVGNKPFGFVGRRAVDRVAVARAFIAKSVLGYQTTESLIAHLRMCPDLRILCGFPFLQSVPSSATFSRIFRDFSAINLGELLHKSLVVEYAQTASIENISRDSTSITAREKPTARIKVVKEQVEKRKRGRPTKNNPAPPAEPSRLQLQQSQSLEAMLAELPTACDVGCKMNSKGNKQYTIGYKVHADWATGGLPISVVVTSASVHDSQVALPLMQITSGRIAHKYELMDAGYDSKIIRSECEKLGNHPIIDTNRRRREKIPMDDEQKERYKDRSVAERGFSQSKDRFGFRSVTVRGHAKVRMHVMFGIISLFALQWQRLLLT